MNAALLVLAFAVQQDTIELKPLVVTATRAAVPADLVASAVTVLRGSDLLARGVRTVAQALETVPGAHVVASGSLGGQTSLFTRGGESDYTKVLVDGATLNQAGGGIDLAHLTLDNVDRIEIVRGPVSVLYGSDAMTGVVQVFTRTGQGVPRLGADLRAGTYGTTEGALDITGGSRRMSYSARVSRLSSRGLYSYNNDYRNGVASARIRWSPDDRSDVDLTYRYGDDIYHFPTDGQGAPVDSNQRSAERGPLLSLNAGRVVGEHVEARISAAVRETRLFYNNEPDSPGEDGAFWSRDYLRRSTTSALLSWRTPRISVLSGIEYEDERQRGTSEFSGSFGTFPDSIGVQRNTTGYFTQGVIAAGPAAITLGGRLDDNSQFGTHGTYRAGVVYRLAGSTRLRASAGTGFKEPTFFENFARGFVLGNPDLDPEQSRSWEVGVERAGVAITYFNQRFRDLIEYTPTPPPGDPNYFNVGAAIADGVEASVTTTLAPRVVFSAHYTFLHTRVRESGSAGDPDGLFVPGKSLIRRPAHVLAPQLAATLGDRTRVTVGARWVGKRDDLDFSRAVGQRRVTRDPYTRVNVSGEYALRNVTLTGSVENVFNDQAQEIPGYRPRGRMVILGGRITTAVR